MGPTGTTGLLGGPMGALGGPEGPQGAPRRPQGTLGAINPMLWAQHKFENLTGICIFASFWSEMGVGIQGIGAQGPKVAI